jgi:hypothetical protein
MPYSSLKLQKTSILILVPIWLFFAGPSALAFQSPGQRSGNRPHFTKAFVVDDRLSVLRRSPGLKSTVVRRLHLGRKVWVVGKRPASKDEPAFYRVAVSRRSSGWIHAGALSIPGRKGEDDRLMRLIGEVSDGFDRIMLYRLFIDNFRHSPLVPQALQQLGEEAESAAASLTSRSRRRLAKLGSEHAEATPRDYYLCDAGLDRYSRIGIAFDFDPKAGEYVYEGRGYREILARFPKAEVATKARARLDAIDKKLGRRP